MATPTSSNGLNTSGSSAVKIQIGRDANVESQGQKPVADNPSTSVMGVSTQVTVGPIKPVDRKTITGSTPGDFRKGGDSVKAPMDAIKNPPSPREQMRGQQNSRNYNENGKSFFSVENASPDSDAGN